MIFSDSAARVSTQWASCSRIAPGSPVNWSSRPCSQLPSTGIPASASGNRYGPWARSAAIAAYALAISVFSSMASHSVGSTKAAVSSAVIAAAASVLRPPNHRRSRASNGQVV